MATTYAPHSRNSPLLRHLRSLLLIGSGSVSAWLRWLVTPSPAAQRRRQQARDRARRKRLFWHPELFVLEDRRQAGVPIEPVSLAVTGLAGYMALQAAPSPIDLNQPFADTFDSNPARDSQLGSPPKSQPATPSALDTGAAASPLDEAPPPHPFSTGAGATSAEDPAQPPVNSLSAGDAGVSPSDPLASPFAPAGNQAPGSAGSGGGGGGSGGSGGAASAAAGAAGSAGSLLAPPATTASGQDMEGTDLGQGPAAAPRSAPAAQPSTPPTPAAPSTAAPALPGTNPAAALAGPALAGPLAAANLSLLPSLLPSATSAQANPAATSALAPAAPPRISAAEEQALLDSYGKLPLRFEANQGQTASGVNFLSRGQGYTLYLAGGQAVLDLQQPADAQGVVHGTVLKTSFVGASPSSQATALQQLPGNSNYFAGSNPSGWQTDVPNFGGVQYQNLYPGIDLLYYGSSQRQLEFDFIVNPGADPGTIRMLLQGANSVCPPCENVCHFSGLIG